MTDVAQLTALNELDKIATETLMALLSTNSNEEAGKILGISRQAVWMRVNKYGLDKIIAQIPKEALMRLHLGSTKAAEKLIEKLDDRREGLQAATEILDRVGITSNKGQTNVQVNSIQGLIQINVTD